MRSPGLAALIDDAAFLAHESALHLVDAFGEHATWGADLAAGTFSLTAAGGAATTVPVQILGSAAPGPRSWLWSWANPTGWSDAVTSAARAARDLGERYGIPELTSPELPFDAVERTEVDGLGLGYDLSLAARIASGTWFAYNADAGRGTRPWFLLEGLSLPAPSAVRTVRVLGEGLQTTVITDHRRAVSSYATLRGLPWDGATLTLPDGDLTVSFDAQGRIAGVSGSVRPA